MDLRNKIYVMHFYATQGYGQGVGFAVSLFSLTSIGTYFFAKFIPAITNYTVELIILTVAIVYMISMGVGYIFYNKGYRQRQHLAEAGANPLMDFPMGAKEILGYDDSILGHEASLLSYESAIIGLENSILINKKLNIPTNKLEENITKQKNMMQRMNEMKDKIVAMRGKAQMDVIISDKIV